MRKYFLLIGVLCGIIVVKAQVHVRDEPRHHNVFENEYIRILNVHLGPGDTTLYHLHNTPSVFIIFTNTNVGSQLIGKQPQKGANVTGEVSYDSLTTPRTHRVWNADTNWFHVMDVELTTTKQKKNVPVLQIPSLKLLFNEQQVNGYSIDLKAAGNLQLPASAGGYLLVSKTDCSIQFELNNIFDNRMMKPSHYLWIEAGKSVSIKSGSNQPASFVLLQLK